MPRLDSGEPVQTELLTQEIAEPTTNGVRTIWHSSTASGLTPEKLAAVLRSVDDRGDPTDYLTLAEEMEERELHYSSVIRTRKLAVSGLDMVIEAATDEPGDVEQADFVRAALDIEEMGSVPSDLLDAIGKGYSVCEIVWDRSKATEWLPKNFIWRDPRFFRLDKDDGETVRLRTSTEVAEGELLPPYKFMVHKPHLKNGLTIRGGLARLAAVAFMCKGYALKDWLAFAEVFGMPFRLGKYGTAATPEQKNALLRAVTNIGIDAAAIVPEDMLIEFLETSHATGGDKLFMGLADWLDRQVSKGVLGQVATVEGTPGRLGADDTQEKVRSDIRDDDAKKLASTIRCDLIKPIIDLNFGIKARANLYPRVKFVPKEKEDLEMLSKALPPFLDRGLPVELKTVLDKFDLPMPDLEDPEVMLLGSTAPTQQIREDPNDVTPDPNAPPEPPSDRPDEDEIETARTKAFLSLLRRIEAGDKLDESEQRLFAMCAAEREDEIDDLAKGALEQWRSFMGPVLDPILRIAKTSNNFAEVEAALAQVQTQIDVGKLVRSLATETFKSRGMGSATDKIKL